MEALRLALVPYYLEIKTIHLLAVAMWSFSTAVAFRDYVVPAFRRWLKNQDDPAAVAARDDAMERFDRGAQLEHVAFPVVLFTGVILVWLVGWPLHEVSWLTAKLALVLLVFLPMEVIDYYLSHFGGNKERVRARGDSERYEELMHIHWRFFKITTPLVVTLIPLTYYLAISKPF